MGRAFNGTDWCSAEGARSSALDADEAEYRRLGGAEFGVPKPRATASVMQFL